jgi:MSHA biogenesis protein MshM
VREGEGFIKITGEVGTGKTLLCRRFLATLGEDCRTAYLPNPDLRPQTLLLALARELGLEHHKETDEYHLIKGSTTLLLQAAAAKAPRRDLHRRSAGHAAGAWKRLRLLSNLETEKRKLLQVVMFGQPELDRSWPILPCARSASGLCSITA